MGPGAMEMGPGQWGPGKPAYRKRARAGLQVGTWRPGPGPGLGAEGRPPGIPGAEPGAAAGRGPASGVDRGGLPGGPGPGTGPEPPRMPENRHVAKKGKRRKLWPQRAAKMERDTVP